VRSFGLRSGAGAVTCLNAIITIVGVKSRRNGDVVIATAVALAFKIAVCGKLNEIHERPHRANRAAPRANDRERNGRGDARVGVDNVSYNVSCREFGRCGEGFGALKQVCARMST
jgi:hypothetical protein